MIYLSHFAINPWNIFFRRRGSEVIFKIGDFGMEIHSDYRAESKIGQEGPHTKYIAPEVINESDPGKVMKERNAGATFADIYSLGMVFKDIKKHIGNGFKVALKENKYTGMFLVNAESQDNSGYKERLDELINEMTRQDPMERPRIEQTFMWFE